VVAEHLPIRCRCGAVRGSLAAAKPSAGNHVICYCDDCQAFAHALGRSGDVLDACGGSEIVQVSPARIRFDAGADKLSCLRLTAKGPLRWYTSCCNTPIGNTLASGAVPFIGMLCVCLQAPRETIDAALGPIRARVFRDFATCEPNSLAPGVPMWRLMLRFVRLLASARLRGEQRRSPFFDARTGNSVAEPRALSASERERLPPYQRARGA
jgi:hypothetical protein